MRRKYGMLSINILKVSYGFWTAPHFILPFFTLHLKVSIYAMCAAQILSNYRIWQTNYCWVKLDIKLNKHLFAVTNKQERERKTFISIMIMKLYFQLLSISLSISLSLSSRKKRTKEMLRKGQCQSIILI